MTHTEENYPSIETNPELTQMLKQAEKDIKRAILVIVHLFKKLGRNMEV